MAEFRWINTPPYGTCRACGTSACDRGFVDMISEGTIFDNAGAIDGIVDYIVCGTCLEQASRYVGCASRAEVEEFAYREAELVADNDKLKDEIKAQQQRYDNLIAFLGSGVNVEHLLDNLPTKNVQED